MGIYRHIGVAVAPSRRLEALLSETAHCIEHVGQRVSLLHAGDHTPEKEAHFRKAAAAVGLPEDLPLHFLSGDPEAALLRAIDTYDLDFMIAGVLGKVHSFQYYLGSMARNLVRNASCSLLLFTEPQQEPKKMERIVVVTDYSESALIALTKAIRFAEREGVQQVYVLRVLSSYGEAMVLADGVRREEARSYQTHRAEENLLQDFVDAVGHTRVDVEPVCIEGHTGLATTTFARDHQADLLVMPSVSHHSHFFERLFPTDMEWVLREIPCNLWIAREQLSTP